MDIFPPPAGNRSPVGQRKLIQITSLANSRPFTDVVNALSAGAAPGDTNFDTLISMVTSGVHFDHGNQRHYVGLV